MKNFINLKTCTENEDHIKIGIIVFLCLEREIIKNNTYLSSSLRKKKKEKFFDKYLEKLESKTASEICREFKLTLNFFWPPLTNRKGAASKIVHTISAECSDTKIVNFMILSAKFNLEKLSSYNLSLAVGDNPLKVNKDFWDCASQILGQDKAEMIQKWGSNVISFRKEREFIKLFGKGFTIWRIESYADRERYNARQRLIFKSSSKNNFVIQSQKAEWDIQKCDITPSDCFSIPDPSLFDYYRCPNCHYNDKNPSNFEKHVLNCKTEQVCTFQYMDLCESFDPQKYLSENKFLNQSFEKTHFVVYDIETLMDGIQTEVSTATKIQSAFKIASIAITKNFGENRSVVFVRDDFSEESYIKLISNFLHFLIKARDEYRGLIPKRHNSSFFEITELLRNAKDLKLSVQRQNNLQKSLTWLNKLRELNCYGYNSERFDNPCLMPGILKALFSKYFKGLCPNEKPTLSNISCIKRGNGYMSIKLLGLSFGDMANQFPGGLDRMGQTFKTPAQKGIFPYELYKDMSELRTCEWPLYSTFRSSLKMGLPKYNVCVQLQKAFELVSDTLDYSLDDFFEKFDIKDQLLTFDLSSGIFLSELKPDSKRFFHLDPVKYAESLILFESMKIDKPDYNMIDWLQFYNLQDVLVGQQAFEKMIHLFQQKFKLNLLEFLSMPSAASRSLWLNMDTSHGSAFTFSDTFGWLAVIFRKALKGGLSVPLHRHAVCGQDANNWPKQVSFKS